MSLKDFERQRSVRSRITKRALRGTPHGVHGTAPRAEQACMLIAASVANPLLTSCFHKHCGDFWASVFIVLLTASFVLLSAAAFVIGGSKPEKDKEDKS